MIRVTDIETGEQTEYTEVDYYAKRDKLLTDWQAASNGLDAIKKREMVLRKEILSFCFDPKKTKGVEYHDLGNGWKLKADKKINYGWIKLNEKEINRQAVYQALIDIEKLSPEGKLVAERLVSWKPDLSLSQYKLLNDNEAAIINKVIVTKPGSPELSIVEPKSDNKPVWNGAPS